MRLLFGKEVSNDHPELYFTCACIRTYNQHTEHKSYCLEQTKPYLMNLKYLAFKTFIFTTCSWIFLRFSNIAFHVLWSSYSIYVQEIKKILAYDTKSYVKLEVSKQNCIFKATKVWNKFIERKEPANSGLIIPGSARNSDFLKVK